jgi:ribosomal-protein-alanine N-acetyltransferase
MATAEDIAGIVALDRATAEAPHWPEQEYRDRLALEPEGLVRRGLFVAILDETLAGYAAARALGDDAELESVVVAEAAQRRGIGISLCRAAMTWAQGLAAETMHLEVRASSLAAQRLYAALGFETVGRRAQYYSSPVQDAMLMRVVLAALNQDHG